jgi:hypothetical protein
MKCKGFGRDHGLIEVLSQYFLRDNAVKYEKPVRITGVPNMPGVLPLRQTALQTEQDGVQVKL